MNYYRTNKEFNKFLKDKNLQSAYNDTILDNRHHFSVNNGWLGIIEELIKDLTELNWDKNICQVKEKFGGLRFYILGGNEDIFNRVNEAEGLSLKTCESCGNEGEQTDDNGWIRTLCDNCKNK